MIVLRPSRKLRKIIQGIPGGSPSPKPGAADINGIGPVINCRTCYIRISRRCQKFKRKTPGGVCGNHYFFAGCFTGSR